MFTLRINSKKFSQDLKKLGCMQCKSFLIRLPNENQVPNELFRHFVRGFFDGDGCISLKQHTPKKQKHHFCIVSNLTFITQLQEKLVQILGISKTKLARRLNVFSLNNTKKLDIQKIYHFLYDQATFFLKRKKDIFETIPKQNRNNYSSTYINVYYQSKSNRWVAVYRDLLHRRKQKKFLTEIEAVNFLKSLGQFKY